MLTNKQYNNATKLSQTNLTQATKSTQNNLTQATKLTQNNQHPNKWLSVNAAPSVFVKIFLQKNSALFVQRQIPKNLRCQAIKISQNWYCEGQHIYTAAVVIRPPNLTATNFVVPVRILSDGIPPNRRVYFKNKKQKKKKKRKTKKNKNKNKK